MITYKKVKSKQEKNNLLFEEENDEDEYPQETYIYTKDKRNFLFDIDSLYFCIAGSIKFSFPVTLKYMYLRKHDFSMDKKLNPGNF